MRDYWMFRGKCHVTRVEAITDKCGGRASPRSADSRSTRLQRIAHGGSA
ncbi:hypothetical protein I549_3119 [Mycobacterium avium subsp. avium 2285 (R)]|nr:hypothetical protein I549_3119 [Mycobacterium avium subsp. avium 2285 (R)]